MPHLANQTFTGRPPWQGFADATVEDCTFSNCFIPAASDPQVRHVVRHVQFRNITQHACWINGLAIEDVQIDRLKSGGDMPLFLHACVFRHVTLLGSITGFKINLDLTQHGGGDANERERHAWKSANVAYYQHVDWALDITKAKFTSRPTFEAVPGSLIRRDPQTQVLLRRSELLAVDWKSFDYGTTAIDITIDWFLGDSPYDDTVVVAASGNRKFKEQLAVLEELRRRGWAH